VPLGRNFRDSAENNRLTYLNNDVRRCLKWPYIMLTMATSDAEILAVRLLTVWF